MGIVQNPKDVNPSESKTDNREDLCQALYIDEFEVKGATDTSPATNFFNN